MRRCVIYLLMALLAVSSYGCRERKATVTGKESGSLSKTIEISQKILSAKQVDTIKLGIVRDGEKVTSGFNVKNNGKAPLVIERINTGCGCVLFGYSREPLMPGETSEMELTFDSAGLYGEIYRQALIYTSLSQTPRILLIEARVR